MICYVITDQSKVWDLHLSQHIYYWTSLGMWKSGFVTNPHLSDDDRKYSVFVSQGCCTFWSMKNSMCSRCPVPTPAPSSPCRGWSLEEKCPSAAPRLAILPPSPFTPNPSTGEKCTGECVAQGAETFQCAQTLQISRVVFQSVTVSCKLLFNISRAVSITTPTL